MSNQSFSITRKNILVTRLICFFWLIAKAMSWKVWLSDRIFPVVSPFEFLVAPSPVHLLLYILSLIAIAVLLIFPTQRKIQVSIIVIELLSCLLDQNRWQPWEYQYIFIIFALFINYKDPKKAVSSIAFIFIAVYFFSGIGKINPAFAQSIRFKIILSEIFPSHAWVYEWITFHAGYVFGAIEAILGIGLLFRATIKIAAILLIVMHLLILIAFGPFGLNYDIIIWPWNVLMILILNVYFIQKPFLIFSIKAIALQQNYIVILCFGILPVLNFFGKWDFFLSASLFSSKTPDMYICIHDSAISKELEPIAGPFKRSFICDSSAAFINVRTWSFNEIMVPAYPEIRVYKDIKKQLLKRYPALDATFIVYEYKNGKKEKIELK